MNKVPAIFNYISSDREDASKQVIVSRRAGDLRKILRRMKSNSNKKSLDPIVSQKLEKLGD